MALFLQQVITGLALGFIYGTVALCVVLVYKPTKVLNFAQGQLLIIGAFFCWTCTGGVWHLPAWRAFLLTMIVTGIVGFVISRLVLRPMVGQPILAAIMMTICLLAVLMGGVLVIWGGVPQVYVPPILPKETVLLGTAIVSQQYLWSAGLALLLLGICTFFFQRTKAGLAMRGTSEDHQLAESVGVDVGSVFDQSWIITAIVSGLIGIVLGSIFGVNTIISDIGLKAFAVVLLGGLESIPGAIFGGLILGLAESMACGYIDPLVGGGIREIFAWVVALVVLLFLPYGLFGWRRIERI
jgi:branched-chain amino acid transport system permease protein